MNERIICNPGLAERLTAKDEIKSGILSGRWTIHADPHLDPDQIIMVHGSNENAPFAHMKMPAGETKLADGYIYAPYIPMQVTPTFLDPRPAPEKKTPLQEIVEGIFAEEIERGELTPIWAAKKQMDDSFSLREAIKKRFTTKLIDPKFFGTVRVENL